MARGPSRREKDAITGGKRASQQNKASRFKGSEASEAEAMQRQSAGATGLNMERKAEDSMRVARKMSQGKRARTLVETSSCPVELRQGAAGWYVCIEIFACISPASMPKLRIYTNICTFYT